MRCTVKASDHIKQASPRRNVSCCDGWVVHWRLCFTRHSCCELRCPECHPINNIAHKDTISEFWSAPTVNYSSVRCVMMPVWCSSLPVSKADLKPTGRHPEAAKTAAVNDQHAINGTARKPIVERITANNIAAPPTPAAAPRSRSNEKQKPPTTAVSTSPKTDISNLHQPRENQPWLNKMKRPSSDVPQAQDAGVHAEERKRPKLDKHPSVPGLGGRHVPAHKSQVSQQELAKLRGDAARMGVSQLHEPCRGVRQVSVRYFFFVLAVCTSGLTLFTSSGACLLEYVQLKVKPPNFAHFLDAYTPGQQQPVLERTNVT